jgi:hypothetical protein
VCWYVDCRIIDEASVLKFDANSCKPGHGQQSGPELRQREPQLANQPAVLVEAPLLIVEIRSPICIDLVDLFGHEETHHDQSHRS